MREDYQRVYVEVSLDAINRNMEQLHQNLVPGTRMIGVIKMDGYGHGAAPIAEELEKLDYLYGFAVATAEEAFSLRRAGVVKPILILGYTFPYSYEKLIEQEVRLTVFREDTLEELEEAVKRLEKRGISRKAYVHIKVDTGMSRIGITPDEKGLLFVQKTLQTKGIEAEGIFTHFARADEADKRDAQKQLERFEGFIEEIRKKTGRTFAIRHCANSAAIIDMPKTHMDVVRAGIALYGLWPSEEVGREKVKLIPALSLHSCIVYIKEIKPQTAVSYGGTYIADRVRRIATIPVGYGDGYPRGLSGRGYVLIHGKKAPILGRVCMDQFMVDVTDIREAKMGDAVTLIGEEGDLKITMEELGGLSGRFNYELACDIGKRVPRVYTKGGKILCTKDYYQDF